jgi:DNA processing protein
VYPSKHQRLAEEILESGGILLSPYPDGTTPRKHQFLERNGLIAALSVGVCVMQAKERSGALNTARQAVGMGKEVMALPGSVQSGLHAGCHSLIREGAALIRNASDIFETLGIQVELPTAATQNSALSERLVTVISERGSTSLEELAMCCDIERGKLRSVLFDLELAGRIRSSADGQFERR